MKFIIIFLLLLISTVYSDSCEEQKKEYEECINAYNEIYGNDNTAGNFKITCSVKCKNFYNNLLTTIPKCFEGGKDNSGLKDNIILVIEYVSTDCATDENGNNCPNTQALIEGKDNNDSVEEIADKTCKSQLCTEALLKIHTMNVLTKTYALNMITKLSSQECRDQRTNKTNINNNNSSSSSADRSTTDQYQSSNQSSQGQTTKSKSSSDDSFSFTGLILIFIFLIAVVGGIFFLLPKSATVSLYNAFNSLFNSNRDNHNANRNIV